MRISDWSSDVCSSDLIGHHRDAAETAELAEQRQRARRIGRKPRNLDPIDRPRLYEDMHLVVPRHRRVEAVHDRIEFAAADLVRYLERDHIVRAVDRSEEHTSELQSLMRISYAVFCLKKKKTNKRNKHQNN